MAVLALNQWSSPAWAGGCDSVVLGDSIFLGRAPHFLKFSDGYSGAEYELQSLTDSIQETGLAQILPYIICAKTYPPWGHYLDAHGNIPDSRDAFAHYLRQQIAITRATVDSMAVADVPLPFRRYLDRLLLTYSRWRDFKQHLLTWVETDDLEPLLTWYQGYTDKTRVQETPHSPIYPMPDTMTVQVQHTINQIREASASGDWRAVARAVQSANNSVNIPLFFNTGWCADESAEAMMQNNIRIVYDASIDWC